MRYCEIFTGKIPFPKTTTEDYIVQAADDIVRLLKQKCDIQLPNHPNNDLNDAIASTAKLLQRAVSKPKLNKPIQQQINPQDNTIPTTPNNNTPSPRVVPIPNIIEDIPPHTPTTKKVTKSSPRPYVKEFHATNFNNLRVNAIIAYEIFGHHVNHVYMNIPERT